MLKVSIASFSFIYGPFPQDVSGTGGGFVFDCRALPNPGRYDEYKKLSGKDESVKTFLKNEAEVAAFFESVKSLIEPSVKNYIKREFESLQISFGCTGGQHRSVYLTEKLAKYLIDNYDIQVDVKHLREDIWG